MQATTGDLALGLARLEGKLDALTQTTSIQLTTFAAQLTESSQERRDLRRDIEGLKTWRAWLTGVGFAIGVLSGYSVLHAFGFHP